MSIKFKKDWYLLLVIAWLASSLYFQVRNLIFTLSIFSLIHLSLVFLVIYSIFEMDERKVIIIFKIWSGLAILGGGLGMLSVLLFLAAGRFEESVTWEIIIRHLLHLVVGLTIYMNANLYIVTNEDKGQEE